MADKGRPNRTVEYTDTVPEKSAQQGILVKQDEMIDAMNGEEILSFTSDAGAGGSATEAMTVTGLLSTDTILAVSQSVDGANNLPLLGFNTLANDALTGVWSADPGAGSVIVVSVKRSRTSQIEKVSLK